MGCYCEFDGHATIYNEPKMVKGRKDHVCYECGCTIKAGERHEYHSQLFEGQWFTPRTCQGCLDLMAWVGAHIPCYLECRMFGEMHERAEEAIEEYWRETVGLKFGWLRRRHKLRLKAKADREARRAARLAVASEADGVSPSSAEAT